MRPLSLAIALLLVACGSGGSVDKAAAPISTSTETTNDLYEGFIDCDPLPEGIAEQPPPDMVVPEGMAITELGEAGPLVTAMGLIDATPVDIRDQFRDRDDVELVYLEDEGFEAEILVDSGDFRTFIKATIRCRTGSIVALLMGPDEDAGALPVPGGQQGG